MTSILRACVSAQKRFFHKDFSNIGRVLTYVVHNSCSPKRLPVVYNVRCFSTKGHEEATKGISEIYYGSLTREIRSLKVFSLLTSACGLLLQPYLYIKSVESGNTELVIGLFPLISFFAVSTPIVLNLVTKKYITHMYYDADKDKYIANTYNLFVLTKQLEFTPQDVVVPDVPGMFINCIIKGNPLFLNQDCFYDHSHYIKIMGYDKPVDFKLGNDNNELNKIGNNNNNCRPETVVTDARYKDCTNKK